MLCTWLALILFLVGSFGEVGAQTDQYVEWLREYCQAFFYGLSVKFLPAVTVAETGCSFRVNSNSHNLQILTGKIMRPSLYIIYRWGWGVKMHWSPMDCALWLGLLCYFCVFLKCRWPATIPGKQETKRCFLYCWNHNDWPLSKRILELCLWTSFSKHG